MPSEPKRQKPSPARMPKDSLFFEKLVPLLLVVMAVFLLVLVAAAVGILLGLIPYQ